MTCKEKMAALKAVVIVPTYNNAGTVAGVLADVKAFSESVIVVNDGSTDHTAEVLSGIDQIRLIAYPENKGKGYALKLALQKAFEWGYRYAVTIDADGQHYADDIQVFIDRIEQVPDSLLVGARNMAADNMPSKNTFANKFSNFWYRVETGKTLSDTQSGYRLYPLRELQDIRLLTRRYEFELEILVRAAWRGVHVENVPVKVYYPPAEERVSHFRPFKDFARISLLNTVLVLYALFCYYPWRFLKSLTWSNIRKFIDAQIVSGKDSNVRMALAMGWGVFCGIIPIWGYQMVFAVLTAHLFRLNKVIAVVFANISIPPMIPFILYGSMEVGAFCLNTENVFSFGSLSLETIGLGLGQYLLGSVVLAFLSGGVVFALAWLLMSVCKRGKAHE